MRIKNARVKNYKSFDDSGVVDLEAGFNVILGKNNSGKTAFLEGFRGSTNPAMPHRDLKTRPSAVSIPLSEFEIRVEVTPEELFDELMSRGGHIDLPIPMKNHGPEVAQKIFRGTDAIQISMPFRSNGTAAVSYPSHELFATPPEGGPRYAQVAAREDKQDFVLGGQGSGANDTLPDLVGSIFNKKVFVFSAERLRLSKISFSSHPKLLGDASNLARVLFEMQTNPAMWENFNSNVNIILPNVRRVVVAGEGSEIEIRLWPVEPSTERSDLVVRLSDSGTGVAQVMAILCAAMTLKQAVICIDEPGNFLHPGAIKSLIAVLKQYDHQYVITTHSLDALVSANPSKIYFVDWADCISSIAPRNLQNLEEHRGTLAELGLSLGDIFGMEHVVWVEGPTEELCLPIVAQRIFGHMPSSHVVVRVRATAELLDKKKDQAIWEIYHRLCNAGGFVPTSASFLFDREDRKEEKIEDLKRQSGGAIRFLPRRTFENYLLDQDILLAELNAEAAKLKLQEISDDELREWLDQNRGKFDCNADHPNWMQKVDAPSLLDAMFSHFLKSEYRKTQHSPSLTRRLLSTGGENAAELEAVVKEAFGR